MMAQVQQQQQEFLKKLEEDKKKAAEEAEKKKGEQGAAMTIRRVIQKVKGAQEESFEQLKKELSEILDQELEKCGSIKDKIKEEAGQGIEQTSARIEATKKAKAEAEEKRKELQEKAEKVLKEMASLIADAEMEVQAVKEAGEPLSADDTGLEDMKEAAEAVNKAGEEAKAKLKICSEFSKENGKNMHVPKVEGGADVLVEWGKLLTRANELLRETDQAMKQAALAKVKAEKKSEATKKLKAWTSAFDKYDKKKSGYLSKPEVKSYTQGVFKFKISDGPLEEIFSALADDPKGIKKDANQLLRLKIAIGCAREKIEDDKRRKEREENEKMLADMKAELQEKVNTVSQVITKTEGLVVKAEKATAPLFAKAKELSSTDMVQLSDEVEASIKEAKDDIAESTSQLEGLKEDVDEALKTWMLVEVNKLHVKTVMWEPRLAKATSSCSSFRDKAKGKEREELEALEAQVIGMIRYHQQEDKLSKEQVFEQFDADKDGSVSETDFIKFFTACKKEEAKEEEGTTPPKKDPPSEEALKRVFKHLDEDEEGCLSKEALGVIIRRLMKVAAETALSSGMSIKDKENKTVRRLEVGEVVDVLEGPVEDETAGVMRVHAKAMKDGAEGWASLKGNQGTIYLADGGFQFKVVKDTIMTVAFELDAPVDKKAKDPTRKLKEGELLEVREWPKLEEKSGLTRMKCKAKSDGLVGWVTTLGNAGTVFATLQ
jgi:Ca2+-binding EF-hand superfamily protein